MLTQFQHAGIEITHADVPNIIIFTSIIRIMRIRTFNAFLETPIEQTRNEFCAFVFSDVVNQDFLIFLYRDFVVKQKFDETVDVLIILRNENQLEKLKTIIILLRKQCVKKFFQIFAVVFGISGFRQ